MKWILLFPLCWLQSCGSETTTSNNKADNKPEIFNSKYVRLMPDTTRMMLIENVVIQYGDLYVEADSALLERPIHTVVVYGIRTGRFKEKPVVANRLKYRNGDDNYYEE